MYFKARAGLEECSGENEIQLGLDDSGGVQNSATEVELGPSPATYRIRSRAWFNVLFSHLWKAGIDARGPTSFRGSLNDSCGHHAFKAELVSHNNRAPHKPFHILKHDNRREDCYCYCSVGQQPTLSCCLCPESSACGGVEPGLSGSHGPSGCCQSSRWESGILVCTR